MDNLSNCKLCGAAPIEIQTFECVKHMCPSKNCTLNHVLLRPEQWQALMGEDRDAVRIQFLADNATMVSGKGNTGIYMLDDVLPYFESEREQCTADSLRAAIDYQMKEQGNG